MAAVSAWIDQVVHGRRVDVDRISRPLAVLLREPWPGCRSGRQLAGGITCRERLRNYPS
jgi:hypothetical protein